MAWKRTEDGISSILKEELQNLGVVADLTPSWTTPIGLRKPDLLCRNAGVYPVEAKFTERNLIVAIAKVQNDYLKYHKVLGIKGGFAILYPEQLSQPMPIEAFKDLTFKLRFKLIAMFPAEDPRPFKVYESQLPEIAKILYEHIVAPPKFVEPSIDYIISSLRESALYLLNGLKHLTGTELEGFFGGEDVFKNILQYEEGKYPVEELKLAAAYLLVNQLLFYHALSRLRPEFPEIDSDKIDKPSDLNQYFEKVLDVNYKMVFSYNVVSLIPPKFQQEVKTIINVISGLGAQKVGGDLLGTIFHDLIPLTQETHKRFVQEELLGIDVMPFAANVAACHLALQSPQYFTDKVSMAIWDSTDLRPGRSIPSVADLKTVLTGQSFLDTYVAPQKETKGVVGLSRKKPDKVNLETYNVVIMNPPFTRQERIPEEYKGILETRFDDYKEYLHGQLGYYGYFILLADRFLKAGGRMALVLPATVLRVRSCEGLRKLWAEKYHIEHIVTTWHRSAFSESVLFREMLLVARKSKMKGDNKTVITVLKKLPNTISESREIAERIMTSEEDMEDDKIAVKLHDYSELKADTSNWFKYVAVSDLRLVDLMEKLLKSKIFITLETLLDNYKTSMVRGVETSRGGQIQALTVSRKERAVKKSDVWVIRDVKKSSVEVENRHTAKKLLIPIEALRPALRRVSLVERFDISKELDYVLVNSFPDAKVFFTTVLQQFKPSKSFWDRWKPYVEERMSQLVLTRRADLSAPGTCLLAFYSNTPIAPPGVGWSVNVGDEEAKILSLWFNSSINVLQAILNRKETRGAFLQLDEYVLEKMLVPNMSTISKDHLKLLLKTFRLVKNIKFPSILTQLKDKHPSRRVIDTAWLEVLGYKGNMDIFLDRLYDSLANEIDLLRKLMAEGGAFKENGEESE